MTSTRISTRVCIILLIALIISACGPVVTPSGPTPTPVPNRPFDVRDGGKSKLLYSPNVIVLADESVSVVCQGRPESVRILNAGGKVLYKIPVSNPFAAPGGWVATFPLFDGLSSYFKPGDEFRVNCFGINGTDGSYLKFQVFYTWAQAEAAGYERPE